MKIIIEKPAPGEEESITIKCHNIPPQLLQHTPENILIAHKGNEIHRITPNNIYYIESVDNKTFLYEKNEMYESKQKLYELDEMSMNDFLRISKSVIVNLSKIKSLSPALSGRFEATLSNGEKVIISRQYVGELKKCLGI
jgi:DNA-binding LytR/AlgR family response regulator